MLSFETGKRGTTPWSRHTHTNTLFFIGSKRLNARVTGGGVYVCGWGDNMLGKPSRSWYRKSFSRWNQM